MSSINTHFTFNYMQPDEYHFSHDSVFLSRRVYEIIIQNNISYTCMLDLCCGCGIVGMDLLFHLNNNSKKLPLNVDLIDVQNLYNSYIDHNLKTLNQYFKHTKILPLIEFINLNYNQMRTPIFHKKYDLIICNPPYFKKQNGKLSPSDFKNRCRFFIDSDLENLIESISYSLNDSGYAFVLLKSADAHGMSIEQTLKYFNFSLRYTELEKIRNTHLFQITKL